MSSRNLLIATDLLPKSTHALARGARLACALDADTTLLHVLPEELSQREKEEESRAAIFKMTELASPLPWPDRSMPQPMVRTGTPWRTVVATATALRSDLLVLGAHERRSGEDVIARALGITFTTQVLSMRICPTLIVREPALHRYRRILLALDLSPNAQTAVRATESLLMAPDSDVNVLHAFDTPHLDGAGVDEGWQRRADLRKRWQSEATVRVRSMLRTTSFDFTRYGIQIGDDPPARAILDAVDHQQPDLLVMGTSGRGPWRRALLGSVANEVLKRGWCDTLIVPDGSFARTTDDPRLLSSSRGTLHLPRSRGTSSPAQRLRIM